MKLLTFTGPHELSPLHDEILAALPTLRPVPSGRITDLEIEYVPVMGVSGTEDMIWIEVPDGTDPKPIESIVKAHIAAMG